MNKFINGLQATNDFGYTENGAIKRTTTHNKLLDMFALGGAYRSRSDEDVILLFKEAYEEDPVYAMKCLFYLRDVRGGQGERRFFRVCLKYAADHYTESMRRNLEFVPEFGRYDDLYAFVGTKLESAAFDVIRKQLELDVDCKTPSLLAKWLKSENTSSHESCELGNLTRKYLGMTHKQYRKTLSILRDRINVLERLMSENRWDEIDFDKIPSKAGLKYRNAFARRDIIKAKYEAFAKDENTKVNAGTLYPYECVSEALRVAGDETFHFRHRTTGDDIDRAMVNKYWDNLKDYFDGANFNGMAIVDTSGSMVRNDAAAPINVAISLGMYCAEKAKGPFHNKFMTFSSNPTFVEIQGIDFCDKVVRILRAEWGGSTNIEAAFDLMLEVAITYNCSQDEIPKNLIVISDMEFDSCVTSGPVSYDRWGFTRGGRLNSLSSRETLFESMKKKWARHGYQMPKLTFWNVDARSNNIPMKDDGTVSYVSGMSPVLYEQIMKGLSAIDLMLDKLNNERYSRIT